MFAYKGGRDGGGEEERERGRGIGMKMYTNFLTKIFGGCLHGPLSCGGSKRGHRQKMSG